MSEAARKFPTTLPETSSEVECGGVGARQRLNLFFHNSPVALIEWDLNFCVAAWNPAAERMFGYSASEVLGRHASLIVPPELRDQIDGVWGALLEKVGGERSSNTNLRKDGTIIQCEWYNAPLIDSDGSVVGVLSLVENVSAERLLAQELRDTATRTKRINEQFLRLTREGLLFSRDQDAVLRHIAEIGAHALEVERVGIWTLSSSASELNCLDLFQRSLSQHSGDIALQADTYPRYFAALTADHVVAAADAVKDPRTSEFGPSYLAPLGIGAMLDVGIRSGGRLIGVVCFEHVGGVRQWSDEESMFASALADVIARVFERGERRKLEARLAQAQKMEALGALASGIAHDFNNLLVAILGNAELLSEARNDKVTYEQGVGLTDRDALRAIHTAAGRAREIVQQILAFGRRRDVPNTPVIPRAIIDEAREVVRMNLGRDVDITIERSELDRAVIGDATQLHQVFVNLMKNAVQAAAPVGGAVWVRGVIVADGEALLSTEGVTTGKWLRIQIQDTGCGISQQHISRIFDPYFTTKRDGEGVGLGLAIAHSVVEAHGGALQVESAEGKGTTISVVLPIFEGVESTPATPDGVAGNGRKVLILDDDENVMSVLAGMAARLGFTPHTFHRAEAALQSLREAPESFYAFLTDLRLGPDCSGEDVIRLARKIRSDLKIVLLSGGLLSGEPISIDEVPVKVLGKPFTQREFAAVLAA